MKYSHSNRRDFLKTATAGLAGASALSFMGATSYAAASPKKEPFKISLAQWSLHRTFRAGNLNNLDFARKAREDFDISGIEYVNQFFKDKAKELGYLREMKKRASDNGVKSLLIMVDGEGQMGDSDPAKRQQAVENHFKWVDAAEYLGCHSIRVNAGGDGSSEEVGKAATDSLRKLSEYGQTAGINVIVENHGGYSSDGDWLSTVIKNVDLENCGTLPDFGNFCIKRGQDEAGRRVCLEEYDRYKGTRQLMPYAKAVSAKSYDFDQNGNETSIDYPRIMGIVLKAGYNGYVGIEYEGSRLSEDDGIRATRDLLLRIQKSA